MTGQTGNTIHTTTIIRPHTVMLGAQRRDRLSDDMANAILKLIKDGQLKVGDALPGQRELSERFNVSRASIREGIRYLEALGILETRNGLGTFVANDTLPNSIHTSLVLWLGEHQGAIVDILQVREAIETKACALAAENASPSQIEELECSIREMEEAVRQGRIEEMTRFDALFHGGIAEASGNPFLAVLSASVYEAILPSRKAIFEMPGRPNHSILEHKAIVEAIRSGDPERAHKAMSKHLLEVQAEIEKLRQVP